MSNQRPITAFCVRGVKLSGSTKRPGEHHHHTPKRRGPGQPRKRPRVELIPAIPFVCSEDPAGAGILRTAGKVLHGAVLG